MSQSVKCQFCNNRTLDPSGRCHLHQNAVSGGATTSGLAGMPAPSLATTTSSSNPDQYIDMRWDREDNRFPPGRPNGCMTKEAARSYSGILSAANSDNPDSDSPWVLANTGPGWNAFITDEYVYGELQASDVALSRWVGEDPSLSRVMRWLSSRPR